MELIFFLINTITLWPFFFPLSIIISAIVLCVNLWFAFKLIDMLT